MRGPRIRDDSTVSHADADGRHVLVDRNRRGQHHCERHWRGSRQDCRWSERWQVSNNGWFGQLQLTGLQLSGFTVSVSAASYVPQSRGVTLTSNQTLSFGLNHPPTPNFTLTGQVTDSATSAPISGATVSINGRYTTVTDSRDTTAPPVFSTPGATTSALAATSAPSFSDSVSSVFAE